MSRRERYAARDLTYSAAHRHELEELYPRLGHRFHVCDRDWTEFCFACREPISIMEEVRDVGQDLLDKGTTVTRRLARAVGIPSWLVGWQNDRTPDVQTEIDRLNRALRQLEAMHPITQLTVRRLEGGPLVPVAPREWWEAIKIMHGEHYLECRRAQRDVPVTPSRLHELRADNPLFPEHFGSRILPFQHLGRVAR
jgi:hypothetical protein